MSDAQSQKIAVIGGGPGGYAAAFLAADLGMKVTLIDPEVNPGRRVPLSRLHSVEGIAARCQADRRIRAGEELGGRIRSHLKSISTGCAPGKKASSRGSLAGLGHFPSRRWVTSFKAKRLLRTRPRCGSQSPTGSEEALTFDRIIIATGSRPSRDPKPQARQSAHDGFNWRARPARCSEDSAGHWWRLHRPRAGFGLCDARHESDRASR